MASLSQGRTAAAQCGLFTYKSVPVIFEPPCNLSMSREPKSNIFSLVLVTRRLSNTSFPVQVRQDYGGEKTEKFSSVFKSYILLISRMEMECVHCTVRTGT